MEKDHASDRTDIEKEIEKLNAEILPPLEGGNLGLVILVALAAAFLLALAYYLENAALILVPLGLAMIWLADYAHKARHDFMRRFATLNGLEYEESSSPEGIDAPYLAIGGARSVHDMVNGMLKGFPIELFNFGCVVGEEKTKRTVAFTVGRIRFKNKLPHIFLDAHHNFFSEDTVIYLNRPLGKDGQIIKLEGDFNEFFTLYAPKDWEIETLQIFAPDIMAELIDHSKMFSLEFFENNLYVYARKTIVNGRDLLSLYRLMDLLADKVVPKLERLSC